MKKFYLFICTVVVLFGCGSGGSGESSTPIGCLNPSTEHIEYMGYYWGMSTAYGNFAEDVADYTNMINIHITGDWNTNIALIEEAIDRGMAPLLYLDGRSVWMNQDWSRRAHPNQDFWDTFVIKLSPYAEYFAGFYVFDEPNLYGIDTSIQEWIISYYNQAFPDILTWATYCRFNNPLPRNLDIVSATPSYGQINAEQYNYYLGQLKMLMYPHQRIAVTMDAYHPDPNISISIEEWKADMAQDYFKIAKCDSRVMALYIFVIMSFDDHLGVEDMPILEEELINIWDEIQTDKGGV